MKHVCNFPSRSPKSGGWKCSWCGESFETRRKLYEHVQRNHSRHDDSGTRLNWNKGLTKETSQIIENASNKLKQRYKSGDLIPFWEGRHHTVKSKRLISESMKKAHSDGRAHNIGQSRWNNEPSWPERWFIEVIEREFNDKNYKREFPFHRYSLDFAWVEKRKCIEIDGEQHQRFESIKDRDAKKDKILKENGWQVLRLQWKEVYRDTKTYISLAKKFIDGD